jgi:hypothetical protein
MHARARDKIHASGRTGVTLRDIEVSAAGTGVTFHACTRCQLLESHVHHCRGNNVLVDSDCCDLIIADNHFHHSQTSHSLSIYAPGDGVRGQGAIVSVQRHGPALARFTTEKLELNKVREGRLRGQDEAGSASNPGLILLFPDRNPAPDGQPLVGGTVRLLDRNAAVLTLDRDLHWNRGDPVSYVYRGKGPDVGAIQSAQ